LVLNSETSILLTEFRKDKHKKAENVLLYFGGYDDYFYHFHIFNYAKINIDVVVVDIPGFGVLAIKIHQKYFISCRESLQFL